MNTVLEPKIKCYLLKWVTFCTLPIVLFLFKTTYRIADSASWVTKPTQSGSAERAFLSPNTRAIFHFKSCRWFMMCLVYISCNKSINRKRSWLQHITNFICEPEAVAVALKTQLVHFRRPITPKNVAHVSNTEKKREHGQKLQVEDKSDTTKSDVTLRWFCQRIGVYIPFERK
jgi:hypothetical protein